MTTTLKRKLLIIFLSLVCALCLAFGLTACSGDDENDGDNGGDNGGTSSNTSTDILFDGLTVTVKDVEITIPSFSYDYSAYYDYSTDGEITETDGEITEYISNNTITFKTGELYIYLGDVETLISNAMNGEISALKAYADGEISISGSSYTETYGATLYADGDNAYIVYYNVSDYDSEDAERTDTTVITCSYDFIESMMGFAMAQASSQIDMSAYTSMIEEYLEDDDVAALLEALNNYSGNDETNALAEKITSMLVTTTEENGATTVTINFEGVQDLLDDLYELTYKELMEKYYGEGTFDNAITQIEELGGKNIYTVITEGFGDMGIEMSNIYNIIDKVVEDMTGEAFDIEAILNGDGDADSQLAMLAAIKEMTVDQFLAAYVNESMTTAALAEQITTYGSYTLIQMFEVDADYAAELYDYVTGILTLLNDSIVYSVTQYADGSVGLKLAASEFAFPTTTDSEGTQYYLTVNGEVTISSTATIPSTAAAPTAATTIYTDFAAAVSERATDGKYTISDNMYLTVVDSTVTLVADGNSYVIADGECGEITYTSESSGYYSVYVMNYANYTSTNYSISLYSDGSAYASVYITKYDENGNELSYSCQYSDGYSRSYTYDAYGNWLTAKYVYSDGTTIETTYSTTYGWEEKEVYTYSDGTTVTYTYTYTEIVTNVYDGYTTYTASYTATGSNGDSTSGWIYHTHYTK